MYQIDEQDIDPYFENLSQEELIALIEHFHNKDLSLPKMLEKYKLDKVYHGKFIKLLPPVLNPTNYCNNCNTNSIRRHLKRGELSVPYCPSCMTEMYSAVNPYLCLFKNVIDRNAKFGNISNIKTISISKPQFDDFDIDVQIFIGSLINSGISENFDTILGWMLSTSSIVPNMFYLKELMSKLGVGTYPPNGINISIDSDVAYKYFAPYQRLNLSNNELLNLWKKITLHETIEIYHNTLFLKGLATNQHNAIEPIIVELLKLFSPGQIVNIIYQAINCKYDEYLSGKKDKQHTANSVIYALKSFAEYKHKNGIKVECFDRPYNCQQSVLSKYFFNNVLKIGESGFSEVPDVKHLDSYH